GPSQRSLIENLATAYFGGFGWIGLGEHQLTMIAQDDELAIGNNERPAPQSALVPLDLARRQVKAAQPLYAAAIQAALVKYGRRNVVLDGETFADRVRLVLVCNAEEGRSGRVIRRDNYLVFRADGCGDIEIEPGAPRVAPQQLAVLRSDADGCLARKE